MISNYPEGKTSTMFEPSCVVTLEYGGRTNRRVVPSHTVLTFVARLVRAGSVQAVRITCEGCEWRWSRSIADWNARVTAQHEELRAQILSLRPDWDPAKLKEITHTYGVNPFGTPGLHVVLTSLEQVDALHARFAKGGA